MGLLVTGKVHGHLTEASASPRAPKRSETAAKLHRLTNALQRARKFEIALTTGEIGSSLSAGVQISLKPARLLHCRLAVSSTTGRGSDRKERPALI